MAVTHRQSPSAASEAFATLAGSKFGSGTYFSRITAMTFGLILSLSKSLSDCRNFMSASIFFAGPQKSLTFLRPPFGSSILTGFTSLMTHTAAITSRTPSVGSLMPFSSSISDFFRVSRALRALLSAGIASASSASHSSFSPCATAAFSFASFSSAVMTSSIAAASADSFSIWAVIFAFSSFATTSFGCKSDNSCCIVLTWDSANSIFSRPVRYRSLAPRISSRFIWSRPLNALMSSRKDVGVTYTMRPASARKRCASAWTLAWKYWQSSTTVARSFVSSSTLSTPTSATICKA
mmetsp:Transcript_34889/g.91313  ORF Transcript_34889/g.91313 Transcript_34889/m.91313 type:complete len:294 (+) Transcript_34889:3631-4512(+)